MATNATARYALRKAWATYLDEISDWIDAAPPSPAPSGWAPGAFTEWLNFEVDLIGYFRDALTAIAWPEDGQIYLTRGRLLGQLDRKRAAALAAAAAPDRPTFLAWRVEEGEADLAVRDLVSTLYLALGGGPETELPIPLQSISLPHPLNSEASD